MKKYALTLVTGTLFLTACGDLSMAPFTGETHYRRTTISSPTPTSTPTTMNPKPTRTADTTPVETKSECDQKTDSLATQIEAPEQQLLIERHYQRVIRKGCDGAIESDRVETVKSPTKQFSLQNPFRNRKFTTVRVFNKTTCEDKSSPMPLKDSFLFGGLTSITGDGKKSIEIKGDLADAVFTYKMGENINTIFVKFTFEDGNSEIVRYPIFVKYEETTLREAKTVELSRRECAEKAKKTQARL